MKLGDVLFFFVRHGETAGNEKNIYRAWSNAPDAQLDPAGRKGATEAGEYLLKIGAPVELLVADSLDRVQETAERIALNFPNARIETIRALHPLDMGDYTLRSKDKYPVEPFLKDPGKRIPGGETLNEFNQRQQEIFKSIMRLIEVMPGGRVVVIGHGSNVAYLHNHVFNKDEKKVGYEGLVDPGGVIAVTAAGLIPLTKVRGKKNTEPSGPEPEDVSVGPIKMFRRQDYSKKFFKPGMLVLEGGSFTQLKDAAYEPRKLKLPESFLKEYFAPGEPLDVRFISYAR